MNAMLETQLTILIVEDEQAIRRFVRAALESEGHRVHEADTLQRGLLEAGTRKPDVVILACPTATAWFLSVICEPGASSRFWCCRRDLKNTTRWPRWMRALMIT